IAASIVSIETPSRSWIHVACSKYGPRTRVVMNPGTSFLTTTTVLPKDFARSTAAWSVASLVVSARMTSTSGIIIGGVQIGTPPTLFGPFVAEGLSQIRRAGLFDPGMVFRGP